MGRVDLWPARRHGAHINFYVDPLRPQLASFGVPADQVGQQEDWHGGSRRPKR